jgi:hypothetical protein
MFAPGGGRRRDRARPGAWPASITAAGRDHSPILDAFYFGAMSPYSWFAAERIGSLLPGAEWRPVFAGGVFKAHGRAAHAVWCQLTARRRRRGA